MTTVNKNIIANYVGKLWGFVSIFIFIRFYIDILGIESYAIINFYAVILGLIAFADAGLTATLNRELAKDIAVQEKANLLFTFERIYIGICLTIVLVIVLFSDIISNNFLKTAVFSRDQISYFIKLIGIGIGLQLFSTLYEGGLMGLQKQVLSNKIKIIWSLFRSGFVIIPLLYFPTLEIYFIWQIICNFVLLIAFKTFIVKELKTNCKPIFSKQLLSDNWKYAFGMMGIAFISAIIIQIDKLVTSKVLDLESFGHYSLATTIAQIPLLVATPIVVAVFPIFSLLVSLKDIATKAKNFSKFSFIITLITAPIVVCIFLYSVPLVNLWTGNLVIATTINYTIKILIIGGFFLCLQLMPFYIALANGHTRTNIITGIVSLIFIIPLILYSVKEYGMIGATFPWLLINFISFVIVSYYIINKFLPNQFFKWLKYDVLLPSFVTILIATLTYFLTKNFTNKYMFLFDMCFISLTAVIVNILLNNKINSRKHFFAFLK